MLWTILGASELALNSCLHRVFITVEAENKISQSGIWREISEGGVCVERMPILNRVTKETSQRR